MRPAGEAQLLARAKARLDRLRLYPQPVDVARVRVHVVPRLFRVPGFRRFRGYAIGRQILLRGPAADEDLIVHELCHVWQAQHRPLRMWLSYARPSTFSRDRSRYRANRYEREARAAVELTREPVSVPARRGSRTAMTLTASPVLEVPGPVEPDQPMPNPPGQPEIPDPPPSPEPAPAEPA
jgi:hypothetical protein